MTNQRVALLLLRLRLFEFARQFRDAPVLNLRHSRQVARAMRFLELGPGVLEFLLEMRGALHDRLFRAPDFVEVRVLALKVRDGRFESLQPAPGCLVGFLVQRLALDLQLDQPTLQTVELLGLGIDLHSDARPRFVHQIDGLVGKLAIGDVSMRQRGGGDDGRIGDFHTVVYLVALLEATQDRDGVLHRRFLHTHLLEAPLKRRILFHALAVFVQRRRPDAMQLAPGQGRLQHVAGVDGALGLARADHVVQFVDEENDLALLLGQLVEHALQALLEFTAELGAGDQCTQVQSKYSFRLDPLRNFAVGDALRKTLDDGRLAHTGFADEHGIVLGAPLQNLHRAPDLVVAPDDRIEFALFGLFGEIDGVLFQRLAGFFSIRTVNAGAAANFVNGLLHCARHSAGVLKRAAEVASVPAGRQHEKLA